MVQIHLPLPPTRPARFARVIGCQWSVVAGVRDKRPITDNARRRIHSHEDGTAEPFVMSVYGITPSLRQRRKNLSLTFSFLFVALIARSQQIVGPATFSPANPSDANAIRATYVQRSVGCGITSSTTVTGTVVRTTVMVGGCLIGPPCCVDLPVSSFFGPLRAGTYTYEIYEVYEG